jgi:hypothetical protein
MLYFDAERLVKGPVDAVADRVRAKELPLV